MCLHRVSPSAEPDVILCLCLTFVQIPCLYCCFCQCPGANPGYALLFMVYSRIMPCLCCCLQVSFHGQTGLVHFDSEGRRQNFSLNIYQFDGINFTKVSCFNGLYFSHEQKLVRKSSSGGGVIDGEHGVDHKLIGSQSRHLVKWLKCLLHGQFNPPLSFFRISQWYHEIKHLVISFLLIWTYGFILFDNICMTAIELCENDFTYDENMFLLVDICITWHINIKYFILFYLVNYFIINVHAFYAQH